MLPTQRNTLLDGLEIPKDNSEATQLIYRLKETNPNHGNSSETRIQHHSFP